MENFLPRDAIASSQQEDSYDTTDNPQSSIPKYLDEEPVKDDDNCAEIAKKDRGDEIVDGKVKDDQSANSIDEINTGAAGDENYILTGDDTEIHSNEFVDRSDATRTQNSTNLCQTLSSRKNDEEHSSPEAETGNFADNTILRESDERNATLLGELGKGSAQNLGASTCTHAYKPESETSLTNQQEPKARDDELEVDLGDVIVRDKEIKNDQNAYSINERDAGGAGKKKYIPVKDDGKIHCDQLIGHVQAAQSQNSADCSGRLGSIEIETKPSSSDADIWNFTDNADTQELDKRGGPLSVEFGKDPAQNHGSSTRANAHTPERKTTLTTQQVSKSRDNELAVEKQICTKPGTMSTSKGSVKCVVPSNEDGSKLKEDDSVAAIPSTSQSSYSWRSIPP